LFLNTAGFFAKKDIPHFPLANAQKSTAENMFGVLFEQAKKN
jgi:hypothetical protein